MVTEKYKTVLLNEVNSTCLISTFFHDRLREESRSLEEPTSKKINSPNVDDSSKSVDKDDKCNSRKR